MGDISIIARRMSNGKIQYGWSGNGGTLDIRGSVINTYYDTLELVDYLFGLGQMELISMPHSEDTDFWYRNKPVGEPHWIVDSENDIYDRIMFIDYVYFYESSEQKWYFVLPSFFSVKTPLEWCVDYMDSYTKMEERSDQSQCLCKISHDSAFRICELYDEDAEFREYCNFRGISDDKVRNLMDVIDGLYGNDDDALFKVGHNHDYKVMCEYFDSWMIFDQSSGKYRPHVRTDHHIETVNW